MSENSRNDSLSIAKATVYVLLDTDETDWTDFTEEPHRHRPGLQVRNQKPVCPAKIHHDGRTHPDSQKQKQEKSISETMKSIDYLTVKYHNIRQTVRELFGGCCILCKSMCFDYSLRVCALPS